ncbi:hypothetical protein CAPTEDRAFT_217696 [Capitella teleta]|uniref:G-protein coupled receptors family 1 profile domain-containing protein n=1 Tax=Capitella teleta TaxID=283909 RepID=X2AMJ8_CAPTE|nr:hypothetical protein CAPTEDRAFT_217696 [Capitella teleta]|eukprot:ELU00313.1 hypothetical protein CAPTEDRAFT_217696 [Capitella teleta]
MNKLRIDMLKHVTRKMLQIKAEASLWQNVFHENGLNGKFITEAHVGSLDEVRALEIIAYKRDTQNKPRIANAIHNSESKTKDDEHGRVMESSVTDQSHVTTIAIESSVVIKTTMEHFNFYMNVVVDGLLCLFGIVGNALTILVVQREKKTTSNAVMLQALALVDSCFLMYVVVYVVLRSIPSYTGYFNEIKDAESYIIAFVLPFGWTSQTATIWMVMVMAVDRYLIVGHPLKASLWCTASNAKKASAAVVIASILFNAVRWPRYYFVSQQTANSTFVSHLSADIKGWHEDLYRSIYHLGLTIVLVFIVPLGVIIIVNIWLITAIKKAMEHRISMTQGQPSKKDASLNVTIMMIILISVFVICQMPDFIAGIIAAGNFQIDGVIYKYYAGVKEALLAFNSACNFYLYLIFNRNMRNTFIRLFVKSDSKYAATGSSGGAQEARNEINPIKTEATVVSKADAEKALEMGTSSNV